MTELDRKREFKITFSKEKVRCYFNMDDKKFTFKDFKMKSKFNVLNKMVLAETILKQTIAKRKATCQANEKKRRTAHLDDDPALLEGVRNLPY